MKPKYLYLFLFLSFLINNTVSKPIKIHQKPIKINWKERKRLIQEYIILHYGENTLKNGYLIDPKVIVIHATETKNVKSTFTIFNSTVLKGRKEIQMGGKMNVSVPYLVTGDGKIIQLHDELIMGRHCIGINYCSIGIENIGGIEGTPLTQKQIDANVELVIYLKKKYPGIEYLIAHSEYRECEKKTFFQEKMDSYRTQKKDPGNYFISNLRKKLKRKNIHFKSCN